MLGHHTQHRRRQTRAGQTLEGVNVIVSRQLARAGMGEVSNAEGIVQIRRPHGVITKLTLLIQGKSRMWLKANALLDRNVITADGYLFPRHIGRQAIALLIQIHRVYQFGRRLGNQTIRPVQIVVAVQWLVNRVGKWRLVTGVG